MRGANASCLMFYVDHTHYNRGAYFIQNNCNSNCSSGPCLDPEVKTRKNSNENISRGKKWMRLSSSSREVPARIVRKETKYRCRISATELQAKKHSH